MQRMRYGEDGRPVESIRVDDYEGVFQESALSAQKDDPEKGAWPIAKQGFSTRRCNCTFMSMSMSMSMILSCRDG